MYKCTYFSSVAIFTISAYQNICQAFYICFRFLFRIKTIKSSFNETVFSLEKGISLSLAATAYWNHVVLVYDRHYFHSGRL